MDSTATIKLSHSRQPVSVSTYTAIFDGEILTVVFHLVGNIIMDSYHRPPVLAIYN